MQLTKKTKLTEELMEINECFLRVGIEMTEAELKHLLRYQMEVCHQIEWVEMDQARLLRMIEPIIASPYFHRAEGMVALFRCVFVYYAVRKKFDFSITDNEICIALAKEYNRYFASQLNTLIDRVGKALIKDGGQYRDESII